MAEESGADAQRNLVTALPPTRLPGAVPSVVSAAERIAAWNTALGTSVELVPLADEAEARAYWCGQGWPATTIEVTLYATHAFASWPEAQSRVGAVPGGRSPGWMH